MREVTLGVRHRGEPECEVSARHPDVTFRSVSSMTGQETERKRIVELRGPPDRIESFVADFRRADAVVAAEVLSRIDANRVFVSVVIDAETWDSISERLSEMGVHYRTGTRITAGTEYWTLYLNDDDNLVEVIGSLERGGNDVDLVRNVPVAGVERPLQLEMTRFLEDLTERQREVLKTAIEMGYYDHGGEIGVADVAERLPIGSTTVWEHLSRAEAKVMDGIAARLLTDDRPSPDPRNR